MGKRADGQGENIPAPPRPWLNFTLSLFSLELRRIRSRLLASTVSWGMDAILRGLGRGVA
jgi:hypothetical protein